MAHNKKGKQPFEGQGWNHAQIDRRNGVRMVAQNVGQLCDGGSRRPVMYFETVDSATSNPSFSSSPWIRGAPHNGFSLLIRRMRSST
jgi:hypothetical protein